MARFKDLTGKVFGKLIVMEFSRNVKSGERLRKYWLCKCECGNMHEVRTDSLTSGNVISCGCVKNEQNKVNLVKNHRHKMSGTRLYRIWQKMKDRCYNPNVRSYENYGERGIKLCDEWLIPDNFFDWALSSGYKDGLTIDRIDNDGNYEPNNCRWSTPKEQARNRSTNVKVNFQGKEMTLVEAAEMSGFSYGALNARYNKGIREEKLFLPIADQGESREVDYNGKIITLRELANITGINLNTLKSRWRAGRRGTELYK
ncbi:hypothetical protein ABE096_13950 [Robertmurraya massiliosenegalensis]|uniref:hypothetical protein n=1 Tax=Robertmurraya TaxID=2837507 RepID=UPI0039A40DDA